MTRIALGGLSPGHPWHSLSSMCLLMHTISTAKGAKETINELILNWRGRWVSLLGPPSCAQPDRKCHDWTCQKVVFKHRSNKMQFYSSAVISSSQKKMQVWSEVHCRVKYSYNIRVASWETEASPVLFLSVSISTCREIHVTEALARRQRLLWHTQFLIWQNVKKQTNCSIALV